MLKKFASTDLGRAILGEAEAGVELREAEELVQRPVRHAPCKAALDGERRRERPPGAPLRGGSAHHRLRGCRHRSAELLIHDRPVRQAPGDAYVRASGPPVDVVVAVERRRAAARLLGRRRCWQGSWCCGGGVRGIRRRLLGVGLQADLDAGEEEPSVAGDEGVGRVHGDVAAPAEQRAVLDAEEVGVGLLARAGAGQGNRTLVSANSRFF